MLNDDVKNLVHREMSELNLTIPFDNSEEGSNQRLYRELIQNTLKKILPNGVAILSSQTQGSWETKHSRFCALLPLITSTIPFTSCERTPTTITFFALGKYRFNSFQFFFEMISQWLVPGKRLNALSFFAIDFNISPFNKETFTLCEVSIRVENQEDLEILKQNLSVVETEIRLGITSRYYAQRILEIKGLSADAKVSMIQERIAYLVKRLPKTFDYNVLTEMQHMLVICSDEFKEIRECRHLSRIISLHYLFRKTLNHIVKESPQQRHLNLKLFRTLLHYSKNEKETKSVLAVVLGINFLQEKEIFEQRHLLTAIQTYIPTAKAVEGSFFANRKGTEKICTFYLEIEKNNGEAITSKEIKTLKQKLPFDLKDCIEHPMHPVFMSRNEEEIMRNILSLSNQIKYLRDIPQVIISFDEQSYFHLFFTIILVRVVAPGAASIEEIFKDSGTFLEYIYDRAKTVGLLRKKYTKEATVFRVKLSKESFLRRNDSIDLNKARQSVVDELTRILGDFRDFNGGMISKENELLCTLRTELEGIKYDDLLLENFFYSLNPDVRRTLLEPQALKTFFCVLLETLDKEFSSGLNHTLQTRLEPNYAFIIIKTTDRSIKDEISLALNGFDIQASELTQSFIEVYENSYLGLIYQSDQQPQKELFFQQVREASMTWDAKTRRF